jgi:hypothetical protein
MSGRWSLQTSEMGNNAVGNGPERLLKRSEQNEGKILYPVLSVKR